MQRHVLEAIAMMVMASSCGAPPADCPPVPADSATRPSHPAATAPPCAPSGAADVDLGGARAVAIAASRDRACALLEDRSVMCWGEDSAERGLEPPRRAPPEPIGRLDGVVELALGPYAGCARRATGLVSCWGYAAPHLGSAARSSPGTWTADTVAVGFGYACAIRDHAVVCGGEMIPFGALPRPVSRIAGISHPIAVGAGEGFACALETGGTVACWGAEYNARPPLREDLWSRPIASVHGVRVESISDATALAVAGYRACALRSGGDVACWVPGAPPSTIANLHGVRKIAVDGLAGCAIHGTGSVSCWIGGTAPDRAVPVPAIHDAIDIALGTAFQCAVRAGGRVSCWGSNRSRELGIDTLLSSETPREVCAVDHVIQVATGDAHACALRDSGELYCWGAHHGDPDGGTGNATACPAGSAHRVSAAPRRVTLANRATQVAASGATTCALDSTGQIACWGNNPYSPIEIKLPAVPAASIDVSEHGLCAVTRAGTVICNGAAVPGVEHATRVRTGAFSCAEVTDAGKRHLVCWGVHATTFRYAIQCIAPDCGLELMTLVEPLACSGAMCVRTTDGSVRCRGDLYPSVEQCTPWPPERLDEMFQSRSRRLSCAVRRDGLVTCSGDNDSGQLGTGRLGSPPYPTD